MTCTSNPYQWWIFFELGKSWRWRWSYISLREDNSDTERRIITIRYTELFHAI